MTVLAMDSASSASWPNSRRAVVRFSNIRTLIAEMSSILAPSDSASMWPVRPAPDPDNQIADQSLVKTSITMATRGPECGVAVATRSSAEADSDTDWNSPGEVALLSHGTPADGGDHVVGVVEGWAAQSRAAVVPGSGTAWTPRNSRG
jgi:hypothetical protein